MKNQIIIILIIISLLCGIGFSVFGLFDASKDYDEYYHLKDIAVTVEAKITYVKEIDDSNEDRDDTDYDAYITYTYNGVKYQDILYYRYENKPDISKTLHVEINPEDPEHLIPLSNGIGYVFLCILLSAFFTAFSSFILIIILPPIIAKNNKKNVYRSRKPISQEVTEDLLYESRLKLKILKTIFIVLLVIYFLSILISYFLSRSYTAPVFYLIYSLILILIYFFAYRFFLNKSEDVSVNIYPVELIEIFKECDSDNCVTYHWKFSDNHSWEENNDQFINFSGLSVKDAKIGTKFYIAKNKGVTVRVFLAEDFSE